MGFRVLFLTFLHLFLSFVSHTRWNDNFATFFLLFSSVYAIVLCSDWPSKFRRAVIIRKLWAPVWRAVRELFAEITQFIFRVQNLNMRIMAKVSSNKGTRCTPRTCNAGIVPSILPTWNVILTWKRMALLIRNKNRFLSLWILSFYWNRYQKLKKISLSVPLFYQTMS
jgi:hypothetical protein